MDWRLLVLCVTICTGAGANSRVRRIVGGLPADPPPPPSEVQELTTPEPEVREPLVVVKRSKKSAEIIGNRNIDGTYSFLGLRYAEPPVKRFRFVRPRKIKPKGLINARQFGPPCPQWFNRRIVGNEDCLFLNIFTPEIPSDDTGPQPSYPVLLWIHGGNFKTGSASQYVPTYLTRKGIVVVTVQYRLGTVGFLNLRNKILPGNAGLFDIAMASRWVKDYIRYFGGNPEQITAGGQGSGASCASHLALNRILGRNVVGILAMSGTPVSPFAIDKADVRSANDVPKTNGCESEEGLSAVRCMQSLPIDVILKEDNDIETERMNQSKLANKLGNLFLPGPTEEGADDNRGLPNFLTQHPLTAIKQGHFPKIPLLTGVTLQETGAGLNGNFLEEIKNVFLNPSFLDKDIFMDLLDAQIGLYENRTVNPKLKTLFSQTTYVKFFTSLLSESLSKVEKLIQHTTDALFNLPAFIFSTLWSNRNNVFLYSFEHKPSKSQAMNFLHDIPLVSKDQTGSQQNKAPSHGDDLNYLFDIRSLEGDPIEEETELNEADQKVRDHFTTAVAEFVRSGAPKMENVDTWKSFNSGDSPYMIINDKPKLANGFKKCTMGLWTGENNILKSSECLYLAGASEIITKTLGPSGAGFLNTITSVDKAVIGTIEKSGEILKNQLKKPMELYNTTKSSSVLNPIIGGSKPLSVNPMIGGLPVNPIGKPTSSLNKKPQKPGGSSIFGNIG